MKNGLPRKQNIAVSAGLNIIRQLCMVAFPLVSYAYATRVLGTSGIGVHEFAQSVISYFALIAALGITGYAVRDGAAVKDDPKKLSEFASQVFSINLLMTIISYLLLAALSYTNSLLYSYRIAIGIASSVILFTTLSVDWVNSLFEDYLYLTIRYIAVQIVAILLLFLLVKEPDDLYIYIFIANFATIVNGIMNFVYVRKFVRIRFTFALNLKRHALPIFVLFCNNVASVIYLNSDITILRILMNDDAVGLYGAASKIYSMIKTVLNAAIFVTIPRFSVYVANKDGRYEAGLKKLLMPLVTVLAPACIGLMFTAEDVIRLALGEDFIGGAGALRILATALFFAVMACFLAYAIIMPHKLEKYFLIATAIAAVSNIILNFIFIPGIGINAAAYTTLFAEILVFVILLLVAGKNVSISSIIDRRELMSVLMGCMAVTIVCIAGMLSKHAFNDFGNKHYIIWLVAEIVISVGAYCAIMIAMHNSVMEIVKARLNRKK